MNTATFKYNGNLRTQSKHIRSGEVLITDAPIDNNGKGEAFSPTDLLASSLVACMLTVMGIAANKRQLSFSKAEASMQKIMANNPRRVETIKVEIKIGENWSDEEKRLMETVAMKCPVAKSLSTEINQEVSFVYC